MSAMVDDARFYEDLGFSFVPIIPGTKSAAVPWKHLQERHPTEEEIRDGLVGNLCRCTGYTKIVKAIKNAAIEKGGGA